MQRGEHIQGMAREEIFKSEPTRSYTYWWLLSSLEGVTLRGSRSPKTHSKEHFRDFSFLKGKMVWPSSPVVIYSTGIISKLKSILKGWRFLICKDNQRDGPGPRGHSNRGVCKLFLLGTAISTESPKGSPFKEGVRWNTWIFRILSKKTRHTTL